MIAKRLSTMQPDFVFEKVLKMDHSEKKAVFLGHLSSSPGTQSIMVVEKSNLPWVGSQSEFAGIFDRVASSAPYRSNDIFSRMEVLLDHPIVNVLDVCTIQPATPKLITKYSDIPKVVVHESYS